MSKMIKKLFLITSSFLLSSTFVASCTKPNDANDQGMLQLKVDLKIDHDANAVIDNYLKNLSQVVTQKLGKPVSITSTFASDGNTSIDRVKANLTDLAFVSSSAIKTNDDGYVPKIQTLTRSFKFDDSPDFYEAGTLDKRAEEISKIFNEIPYRNWTDENRMWDGNKYEFFYGPENDLISFYRGMILIGGDEETLTKIKEAWMQKNWNAFSSYGIGGGRMSSNGRYIYPLNLLKKHFGDKDLTIPNYQSVRGREIGTNPNVHIVFDDMNSFAWTQNKNANVPNYTFNPKDDNTKVEILSLTDPALYDIGVFNKRLPEDVMNAVSEGVVELAQRNQDPYGPTVGYNGYRVIKNVNNEVYQFINKATVN
ncbi:DNA repair protein [Mycoplasma tullyi]|uniref:DNA repair protein n=1 Tax=Mycoplasma tullyi TaxID=1612150 RepID=A0A7D7U4L5_9MOLU|nr:DNA repair protein [Mycoplasma tullyi]QMT98711.1 DNA repair protein [Mycoplasma tullyi]